MTTLPPRACVSVMIRAIFSSTWAMGVMFPVAVGALHHDDIRILGGPGIAKDGHIVAAEGRR